MIPAADIELAHATRIEDEIARRGLRLVGRQERKGPCPICGGTDRFAINIKKQVWNCRGCQHGGDVIALVQHLDGGSYANAVAKLIGEGRPRAAPSVIQNSGAPTKSILDWWNAAQPIKGTLAARYLYGRRIFELPPDPDEMLRFHPEVIFGKVGETWRYVSCLLALVRDVVTNEPIGLQRIGLTKAGEKIERLSLGSIKCGVIKLWDNAEVSVGLVIAEGIETALAASVLEHQGTLLQPIWATLSADNLETFPVLRGIEALTIVVDADDGGRGQAAAAACAERWQTAGREVTRLTPLGHK
jgi:phage/plasmid primase-like uncharacterized protein